MLGPNDTVGTGLVEYYEYIAAHLHKWVDPLSNEQFWQKPYAYGNSPGHLVLHLTGNLNYYIGARLAETGSVRDRDREFTEKRRLPKDQVLRALTRQSPWWWLRFESRAPTIGERPTPPIGNRRPRIDFRFLFVVRGMRIIT